MKFRTTLLIGLAIAGIFALMAGYAYANRHASSDTDSQETASQRATYSLPTMMPSVRMLN